MPEFWERLNAGAKRIGAEQEIGLVGSDLPDLLGRRRGRSAAAGSGDLHVRPALRVRRARPRRRHGGDGHDAVDLARIERGIADRVAFPPFVARGNRDERAPRHRVVERVEAAGLRRCSTQAEIDHLRAVVRGVADPADDRGRLAQGRSVGAQTPERPARG